MSVRALREARRMFKVGDRLGTAGRPDYTERNRALLEQGLHPVTKTATRPDLGMCGDCVHHVVRVCSKRYQKCERHPLGTSRSAASDIRVSWPACEAFEAKEEWRAAVGFEDLYEVSDLGRVRRVAQGPGAVVGRVLRATPVNTIGHLRVYLRRDGRYEPRLVHRLVAEAFGLDVAGRDVHHLNGVASDNRFSNLAAVTRREHMAADGRLEQLKEMGRS